MRHQKTDPEETTSQFMHALAAAEVDAANISAERSDDPDILTVTSLIEPADIEDASEIAGEHDFTEQQRGEIVNGRETVTYKLEA